MTTSLLDEKAPDEIVSPAPWRPSRTSVLLTAVAGVLGGLGLGLLLFGADGKSAAEMPRACVQFIQLSDDVVKLDGQLIGTYDETVRGHLFTTMGEFDDMNAEILVLLDERWAARASCLDAYPGERERSGL